MANEATLVFQTSLPIPFTCADGTGITKGALLKLTDPMTASLSSANNDLIAGIAATDKIASDGVTKIGVYRSGIFKMKLSGSISVGDPVTARTTQTGDANHIGEAFAGAALTSGARLVGIALETGTTGETILVELRPTVNLQSTTS